jgi:hypothetical protein
MLLAQKCHVEGALALCLSCARLIDETHSAPTGTDRADAKLLLEMLTPIAKSWPSQWCVEANSLAMLARIRGTASRAEALPKPLADWAHALTAPVKRVEHATALLWQDGQPTTALANATIYLEAAGHVVLAWIWLEQALAAHRRTGPLYDGKRVAAQYFFRYELPKTTAQFDLLDIRDRTTTDLDEGWF